MKSIALSLFVIINLVFGSCSKPVKLQQETPKSSPVLEMSKELLGLWDVNGKLLDFRLYENGLVKYDFVDYTKKVSGKLNKTDDLKISKQIQLSESEIQELLKLLTSNEFQNLKDSYKPNMSCIDNFIENVIIFRYQSKEKKIQITGHCDDLKQPNTKYFPTFPTILSDLYKQINRVKNNAEVDK